MSNSLKQLEGSSQSGAVTRQAPEQLPPVSPVHGGQGTLFLRYEEPSVHF